MSLLEHVARGYGLRSVTISGIRITVILPLRVTIVQTCANPYLLSYMLISSGSIVTSTSI